MRMADCHDTAPGQVTEHPQLYMADSSQLLPMMIVPYLRSFVTAGILLDLIL